MRNRFPMCSRGNGHGANARRLAGAWPLPCSVGENSQLRPASPALPRFPPPPAQPGVPVLSALASTKNILWLHDLRLPDLAQAGGKNSSLGEMIGQLAGLGVSVPGGFATRADALREL